MSGPTRPRFTLADAERAADAWGANCGPCALAAIAGLTLDQVRPLIPDFERKGFMNPTMMLEALERAGLPFQARSLASNVPTLDFPRRGLAGIQWEGPWTQPGVPIRARYCFRHWVGAARRNGEVGIFDINCMNNGSGWCALEDWTATVVPHLVAQYPRANGKWHITNAIEIEPAKEAAE